MVVYLFKRKARAYLNIILIFNKKWFRKLNQLVMIRIHHKDPAGVNERNLRNHRTWTNPPSLINDCNDHKLTAKRKVESLRSLDSGTPAAARLHKLKLDFSQLKISLRQEWYTKFIASDLQAAQDRNDPLLKPTEDKSDGDVADTLYNIKDKLENSKEKVEELSEQVEILLNDYKECLTELEITVAELNCKRKKLTELSAQSLNELAGFTEDSKQISEKENRLRQSIEEIEAVTFAAQNEVSVLLNLIEVAEENIKEMETLHWSCNGADRLVKWCDGCISLLQSITGIRDCGFSKNQWKIAILGSVASEGNKELAVTMPLSLSGPSAISLTEVQVDCHDIDVDSIIKEAISNNDVACLLYKLHDLWLENVSLITEIESLRESYIIDWRPDSYLFYVMFTKSVDALCTLRIGAGYPSNGSIILDKLKTHGKEIDPGDFKPPSANPSLTDWLCYLKERLDPEPME